MELSQSAVTETEEEAGSFPENCEFIKSIDFKDDKFTYRTYIYDISKKEKKSWTPTIVLNWENQDYQWFTIDRLPPNIHFGVKEKLEEIKKVFNDFQYS
jgi:hypothetical protein